MKKIFTYVICLLAYSNVFSQGEWVSASIDNGPTASSTALFLKSTTEFDANKCDNIVFTVRIPISAGPAVTITESFHAASFSHITFNIQKLNVNDGTYYYYLVNGTGTVQVPSGTIIPINTPVKILELTYNGGTSGIVQLANIENDIPGNSFLRPQFYIQIDMGEITNLTTMFYGTAGAIPVNNQAITGDDFVGTFASVALPVKFLSFTATKKENNAALIWNVANENALTDHYDVERRTIGNEFVKIATVQPKNNGSSSNRYETTDFNITALPSYGVIYYRIKQTDKDGKFVYSEIRSVRLDGKTFDASVYPNPVVDIANINIDIAADAKIIINITDALGKEIQAISLNGIKGLNTYKLNMDKLAAGTYLLKINAGKDSKTIAVVKRK